MQICEDIPQVLDSDVPGLAERPINIFLPRLFRVSLVFYFLCLFSCTFCNCILQLFFFFCFTVFPITSCFIKKAVIGFCKSIHYVNACCKYIMRLYHHSSVVMKCGTGVLNCSNNLNNSFIGLVCIRGSISPRSVYPCKRPYLRSAEIGEFLMRCYLCACI